MSGKDDGQWTYSLAPVGRVRTPLSAFDIPTPPPLEAPPAPPPRRRAQVASIRSRSLRRIMLILAFPFVLLLAVPLGIVEGIWRNFRLLLQTFAGVWRL